MTRLRRALAAALSTLLTLAAFPAWAQTVRVVAPGAGAGPVVAPLTTGGGLSVYPASPGVSLTLSLSGALPSLALPNRAAAGIPAAAPSPLAVLTTVNPPASPDPAAPPKATVAPRTAPLAAISAIETLPPGIAGRVVHNLHPRMEPVDNLRRPEQARRATHRITQRLRPLSRGLDRKLWGHARSLGFALPGARVDGTPALAVPQAAPRILHRAPEPGRPPEASRAAEPGRTTADPVPQPETGRRLPGAYRLFLGGLVLSSAGQAVATVLLPVLSYAAQGPGFAVLSQAVGLLTVIPGSWLGAWWVPRLGSKSAYVAANALNALVFLSVPLAVMAAGGVAPAHFLLFSGVSGVAYGMLRGVAEQDLTVRIVGQQDEGLLQKAGSMYYLFVAPVYILTSLAAGAAMAWAGKDLLTWTGAVAMLASVAPFALIRLGAPSGGGSAAAPGEAEGRAAPAGRGERLPLSDYLPYLFFWSAHLALYYLFAPFFALELFGREELGGWLTGLYALGNFLVALAMSYAPAWMERLSRRQWSLVGVASTLLFLWGTLGLGSVPVSLAAAALMGFGLVAGMVQWRAHYQKSLPAARQPAVFQWLSIAGVAANAMPFGLLYGATLLWPGLPLVPLLAATAAGFTLAGLALAAFLRRR